jgi:predicted permease
MARAYNGNHQLAAVIVVITTLAAVLTINVGLLLLQWAGWI